MYEGTPKQLGGWGCRSGSVTLLLPSSQQEKRAEDSARLMPGEFTPGLFPGARSTHYVIRKLRFLRFQTKRNQ